MRLRQRRHGQQRRRRQIGDDQAHAVAASWRKAAATSPPSGTHRLGQGELLAIEVAGRVVVGDAEPRAGDTLIGGGGSR